jgi:hypothetical protein
MPSPSLHPTGSSGRLTQTSRSRSQVVGSENLPPARRQKLRFQPPLVPGMLRSLLRPNCVHQTPVTRYRQMSPTLMKYALTRYLSQVVAMPNDID